jgi:hypothetical protein
MVTVRYVKEKNIENACQMLKISCQSLYVEYKLLQLPANLFYNSKKNKKLVKSEEKTLP